jgi:hypothetical protein
MNKKSAVRTADNGLHLVSISMEEKHCGAVSRMMSNKKDCKQEDVPNDTELLAFFEVVLSDFEKPSYTCKTLCHNWCDQLNKHASWDSSHSEILTKGCSAKCLPEIWFDYVRFNYRKHLGHFQDRANTFFKDFANETRQNPEYTSQIQEVGSTSCKMIAIWISPGMKPLALPKLLHRQGYCSCHYCVGSFLGSDSGHPSR